MAPFDFASIETMVVAASHRPTNADQRAACHSLTALAPQEKIRALRLFIERDQKRRAQGWSGDWVPHVYIQGAIGPREVLPWSRDDLDFMLNAIIAETGVLPPAIALRAVKEFAANRELDAALRETVERTAHAMWPDDDGEGALFRKTAAALRALIGAPVKVSKKPAKPAPVQASKTKTKAKTPAKTSFADAVRRHMKGACPGYRFLSTSGGSGPLVTFERASPAKMRELKERVVFQKGLHGASWFRVSFFADIEGAGANGGVEHTVLEGAPLGKDVSFESNSALEAALGEACARLEATAARVFAPVEKRFRDLDRLFGHLVAHYSRFLAAEGAKLSSDDFVETEGSNPSTVVAFDAFVRSLVKQKLIFKDSKIDLATPLWRFWHDGRPMRASDYRKGDYYDCATCRAFVSFSKGKLVPRKVSGFGVHHAFVCNKH